MEAPLIEAHPKLSYVAGPACTAHAPSAPALILKAPQLSWVALVGVLIAHVAVVFALASVGTVTAPLSLPAPLMVEMIAPQPDVPPPKPVTALPRPKPVVRQQQPQPAAPVPVLAAQTTTPAPAEASVKVAPPAPYAPPAPPAPVAQSAPRFDADYLNNPAPAYPSFSRRAREEGKVMLRVMVEPNGLPSTVSVQTGSGFERLDDAALAAVRRWKFVPARRGAEAVSATVLVPIVFSLKD